MVYLDPGSNERALTTLTCPAAGFESPAAVPPTPAGLEPELPGGGVSVSFRGTTLLLSAASLAPGKTSALLRHAHRDFSCFYGPKSATCLCTSAPPPEYILKQNLD